MENQKQEGYQTRQILPPFKITPPFYVATGIYHPGPCDGATQAAHAPSTWSYHVFPSTKFAGIRCAILEWMQRECTVKDADLTALQASFDVP